LCAFENRCRNEFDQRPRAPDQSRWRLPEKATQAKPLGAGGMYQCQPALERPNVGFSEFYDRRNGAKPALRGRCCQKWRKSPVLWPRSPQENTVAKPWRGWRPRCQGGGLKTTRRLPILLWMLRGALSSGAHSRDLLARNDARRTIPHVSKNPPSTVTTLPVM
jgi:hypothetical protein